MKKTLFVIGAGAVGSSLSLALKKAGRMLKGVYDLNPERATELAGVIGCKPYSTLSPEIREADLVLVMVSDGAIKSVAKEARALEVCAREQIWLHVSGALPAVALSALEDRVQAIGAFHPAHVFAPGQITELMPGVCFGVDGNDTVMAEARNLAEDLGGQVVRIPADLRPLYHAATVLASNCVVALLAEARNMLNEAGIAEQEAEPLLTCLAMSATSRTSKSGLDAGLSGPVRRGDAGTIEGHLKALSEHPHAKLLYETLGRSLVRLTERIGDTDRDSLKKIEDLLGRA
jgi:predicted short-subunit dehydrogenase-like oxidoreductase (DUF2520 family)